MVLRYLGGLLPAFICENCRYRPAIVQARRTDSDQDITDIAGIYDGKTPPPIMMICGECTP